MKRALLFVVALLLFVSNGVAEPYSFARAKGLKRDHAKLAALLKASPRAPRLEVAAQFAARGDLSSQASLCRNQGSCGSCWAYALSKALQSELMIHGTAPTSLLDAAYLVDNCGKVVNEYGCNGGDFPAGQNFLNGKGPWGNGVDPVAEGACKNLAPIGTALSFVALGNGSSAPTFQDNVAMLSAGHVGVIDIAADDAWSNYPRGADSNGVWRKNTSSSIDHMINRVGWDCETSVTPDGKYCVFGADGNTVNHDGYFIDMNNWSENWGVKAGNGHGGYIKESWLANQSGQTVMYFTVSNSPIPPGPIPPTPSCTSHRFYCQRTNCRLPWCH